VVEPTINSPADLAAWKEVLGENIKPGDVLAGKYRLERLLGVGGMGAVVQAWHVHFDERVAVKFLRGQVLASKNGLARFEREARSAFKIKSEHAARVIDLGFLESGLPYIVMEFLQGQDLGKVVETRGALPTTEAVDYLLQAAEAIAEAHTRGIVHRDLKPENLFLTQGADGFPCVKVVDFGISKAREPDDADEAKKAHSLTSAGAALGTPSYMAPEQWGAAGSVGPSADVWALGVILYELLSAHTPFQASQLGELCKLVLMSPPSPLRGYRADVPEALEQIIVHCLEKDPAARFPNVAALAVALQPYGSARAGESVTRITGVQRTASTTKDSGSDGHGAWGQPTAGTSPSGVAWPAGAATGPTPQGPGLQAAYGQPTVAGAPVAPGMIPGPYASGTPGTPAAPNVGAYPTGQSWQQTTGTKPTPSRAPLVLIIALGVVTIGGLGGWLALRGARSSPATEASSEATAASALAVAPTATAEPTTAGSGEATAGATSAAPSSTATASAASTDRPPSTTVPSELPKTSPATTVATAKPKATAAPTVKPKEDPFHKM
jgi:eukaryotic-like serine/threonine-protein kinase